MCYVKTAGMTFNSFTLSPSVGVRHYYDEHIGMSVAVCVSDEKKHMSKLQKMCIHVNCGLALLV